MRHLGIQRGDVVSFQLPNWWEAAVVFCATARLGAIANPILPIFRERELEFVLRQSEARLLFIPETFRNVDYPALVDRIHPRTPALEHVVRVRDRAGAGFQSLLGTPRHVPDCEIDPADLLLLMYTSGTTAAAKGVLHTHATLVSEVRSLQRVHSLTPADSTLMPSPLTHISGVLHGIMTPAILGTRAVLMERWDAAAASLSIEREGITYMVGAPVFLQGLIAARSPERRHGLRLFSCGGASVSADLMREANATLGCVAKRVYGSTEFPTMTTTSAEDAHSHGICTEGRPIPPNQLRIIGSDGAELATGQSGEIQARGPECFVGYVDAQMNDDAFTADGWFRTGDLGRIDADGYLTVTGRLKQIVIRKGEKISILEVETMIASHPAVIDVCLVGIADADVGERACAAVVSRDRGLGAKALLAFLREKGLAPHKLPERLTFLSELPRTDSGKVHRAAVSAMFEAQAERS